MATLAQQLFVVVGVAATIPQRLLVVDCYARSHAMLSLALLAQATVTLSDALSILDACPSSLALYRTWAICERWQAGADSL